MTLNAQQQAAEKQKPSYDWVLIAMYKTDMS